MSQPFHVGKPWCTFAQGAANAVAGMHPVPWGGGDGDGDIDLAPGDNTTLHIAKDGLWIVGVMVGRGAVAVSSGIVGGPIVDGVARGTIRSIATTGVVSVQWWSLLHVPTPTDVQFQVQFSASAAVAFDNCRLEAVRIGPLRWT